VTGAPVATAPATSAAADEFVVQTWYFRWTVATNGTKSFGIEKTNKGVRAVVIGQIESLFLSPKAAHEIGDVLAQTDEYARKLAAKKAALTDKLEEVSETVKTAEHTIVFRIDSTYGFLVSVRSMDGGATVASVLLDQKDANAFSASMQKAEAMAAYIDRKVKP